MTFTWRARERLSSLFRARREIPRDKAALVNNVIPGRACMRRSACWRRTDAQV